MGKGLGDDYYCIISCLVNCSVVDNSLFIRCQ